MIAGRLLTRAGVVPALLVAAWLLAGLALLLGGVFTALPVIALATPLAVLGLGFVLRHPPGGMYAPWWAVAAVFAIAVTFAIWQGLVHAEQIIVRRDPGSYVQFATWIAEHGELPVDPQAGVFGHDPAVSYQSLAFYQRDGQVVPQFMAGLPLLLAAAQWIGGTGLVLLVPVLLGAVAIVAFGSLVARLVGPRWAPLGALGLALTLPEQVFSRSAYSEPLTQILVFGGLCLLLDSLDRTTGARRITAAVAGLALGLTVLVRIDGLRDILPVLVYVGLLGYRRRPQAWPLGAGLVVGAGLGVGEGYLLSPAYLSSISGSVIPLLIISAGVLSLTVAALVAGRLYRRRRPDARLPDRVRRWAPGTGAAVVVLVMLGFALRPLFQTVRQIPDGPDDAVTAQLIEGVQKIEQLPVDGTRLYSELSLQWVTWYLGVPAVLLATVGAALLVRRILTGGAARWILPSAMIGWTTVTTLYRPAITPDHPWADRRLLVLVLPGLLLLAVWAVALGAHRMRARGRRPVVRRGLVAVGVLAICVPEVITSIGMMTVRTDVGELAAVRGLCRAVGPDAGVLIVERVTGDRFTQLVRGMCDVPTARMEKPTERTVRRVVGHIRATGRRPVLLGANAADLTPYGGRPVRVLRLRTQQDPRSLTHRPHGAWSLSIDVWMSRPS